MTPAAAAGSPADPPPAGEPTAAAAGPTDPRWERELQRAAADLERNKRRVLAGVTYAGRPAQTWRRKPGRRGDRQA